MKHLVCFVDEIPALLQFHVLSLVLGKVRNRALAIVRVRGIQCADAVGGDALRCVGAIGLRAELTQ